MSYSRFVLSKVTFSVLSGLIFSPRIGMKLAKILVNSPMVLSFV